MALNIQTFKTRALTALIFVAVMLVGLLWNYWTFFILFSIIHFGCWLEYQKIVALIDPGYKTITPFHKYGVMIAGWCLMLYFTNNEASLGDLRLHAVGWWLGLVFLFVLPVVELLFAKEVVLKNIGHSAFGLLYISLSFGLLMDLRGYYPDFGQLYQFHPSWHSMILPCVIILCLWINDTMAYIVGSLIGKTPFSKISPKKTWEGTAGGAILCVTTLAIAAYLIHPFKDVSLYHWIAIAAIVAISGTAGDLLESKLKRMANIKDSGQIMPGHGGFLDRFDSLLLSTPFVWLYVTLFMK